MKPEDYLHIALCDGLSGISYWGFDIKYSNSQYEKEAEYYRGKRMSPCYEDVLVRIIENGGKIKFVDIEGEGAYSVTLTQQMLHDNMKYVPQEVLKHIESEDYDAEDTNKFLQSILFKEVIFG